LVGYTNAGKSTLLNRIAGADVYVADQLFATLDPTTRRIDLPGGAIALLSDTVGFIQKLPTELIAAFRATLEEISEADLLLHVIDVTHSSVHAQAEAVLDTLKEIDADHIPVISVLNKIDKFNNSENAQDALSEFADAVAISALTGQGIDNLRNTIHNKLFEAYISIRVRIPYKEGALIAIFHEQGQIEHIEHMRIGVVIHGRLPGRLVSQFRPYIADDMIMDEN
jgi:GTP-binding protein HflX